MTDDQTVRSADEIAPDLSGDLTRLANLFGEPYDYLRNLLSSLPAPFLPTVRSARASPANPVSDASEFGTGLGLAGGPIGQSSGTEIGSGIANLDIYNLPALAGGGFPVAWRRFLTGGVYNGDFGSPTLVSANVVDNVTNPLPYWALVQSVGTTFSVKWGADAGAASGGVALLSMAAAVTAADEGYIEQIIPINGSRSLAFMYIAAVTLGSKAGVGFNRPNLFLETQFLKADKVTTTGTATRTTKSLNGTISLADVYSTPNGGAITSDAYYLRLRVGLVAVALGNTITDVPVTEVRVYTAPIRQYLASSTTAPGPAASSYWEQLSISAVETIVLRAGGASRFTSEVPYRYPAIPVDIPSTGSVVAGTVAADITGCTTTFTPTYPETVIVTGIFDVDISVASTSAAVGELVVDGVAAAEQAIFRQNTDPGRATVTQKWVVALTAAAHTLKLQCRKSGAGGTITFTTPHTKMIVERQG